MSKKFENTGHYISFFWRGPYKYMECSGKSYSQETYFILFNPLLQNHATLLFPIFFFKVYLLISFRILVLSCFRPIFMPLWNSLWVASSSYITGMYFLEKQKSHKVALNSFCYFCFRPHHIVCGILILQPGIEPGPWAVKVRYPIHRTAREFPC